MAVLKRASWVPICLSWIACGAPLADDAYRGEPLFKVEGQLGSAGSTEETPRNVRASIFWSRSFEVESVEDLVEQRSTSAEVRFPSTFELRFFRRPEFEHALQSAQGVSIGVMLLYEDRDQNQRFDGDDRVLGGTISKGIVFSKGPLTLSGVAIPAGFSLIDLPFLNCPEEHFPVPPEVLEHGADTCRVHGCPEDLRCDQRFGFCFPRAPLMLVIEDGFSLQRALCPF